MSPQPQKTKLATVLQAWRSPLNHRQWLCALDCGHEVWRSYSKKPLRFECPKCAEAERQKEPTKKGE